MTARSLPPPTRGTIGPMACAPELLVFPIASTLLHLSQAECQGGRRRESKARLSGGRATGMIGDGLTSNRLVRIARRPRWRWPPFREGLPDYAPLETRSAGLAAADIAWHRETSFRSDRRVARACLQDSRIALEVTWRRAGLGHRGRRSVGRGGR